MTSCLASVEEFFFDSVVSVFARWARVYSNEFALFETCIFPIGQIAISSKSSSGRMRLPRSTKLSAIVRVGAPPYMHDLGPRPSPLEGVKEFSSNAIFSVTAADSAAVLSALGAALGSLTSAPEDRGPYDKFGARGPHPKFHFFRP